MTREEIHIGDIVTYDGYPNNRYRVERINANGDILLDCIKGAYHCIPYANVEKMTLIEKELPQGLDEAAEEAGLEYAPIESGEALDLSGQCYETDDVNWPSRHGFLTGFKAGAKWMAGQYENIGVGKIVFGYEDGEDVQKFSFTDRKDIVGLANSKRYVIGEKVKVYIKKI